MALPPEEDPTRKVRRIGWAVIIVFAVVILALFVVLIFVDPNDDDEDPDESGWLMPDAPEEAAWLPEATGVGRPLTPTWVRLGVADRLPAA